MSSYTKGKSEQMKEKMNTKWKKQQQQHIFNEDEGKYIVWVAAAVQLTFTTFDCDNGDDDEDDTRNT